MLQSDRDTELVFTRKHHRGRWKRTGVDTRTVLGGVDTRGGVAHGAGFHLTNGFANHRPKNKNRVGRRDSLPRRMQGAKRDHKRQFLQAGVPQSSGVSTRTGRAEQSESISLIPPGHGAGSLQSVLELPSAATRCGEGRAHTTIRRPQQQVRHRKGFPWTATGHRASGSPWLCGGGCCHQQQVLNC